MFRIALGFTIGYVLGAKAGRERYEQIHRLAQRAANSPRVQGAMGLVEGQVMSVFGKGKHAKPDMAYLEDV